MESNLYCRWRTNRKLKFHRKISNAHRVEAQKTCPLLTDNNNHKGTLRILLHTCLEVRLFCELNMCELLYIVLKPVGSVFFCFIYWQTPNLIRSFISKIKTEITT